MSEKSEIIWERLVAAKYPVQATKAGYTEQPKPDARTYLPIVVSNQWGHLSYTVNSKPVTFSESDGPDVEWPDGHRSTERIVLVTEYTTIGDHGQTYTVTNRVPYVAGVVHGAETRIALTLFKLAVDESGEVVK